MCFMAIDELNEVNSNISFDNLQDAFEDLYEDLENLGLKKKSLSKRKFKNLERNLKRCKKIFQILKMPKLLLKKRMTF